MSMFLKKTHIATKFPLLNDHHLIYYIIMKTLAEIRWILEAQKPYLLEKYGIHLLGVYGSYVRGEQRSDSDIDLLIDLERPARLSFFDMVEVEELLGELLGIKMDMAIKSNLRKRIGQRILAEMLPYVSEISSWKP